MSFFIYLLFLRLHHAFAPPPRKKKKKRNWASKYRHTLRKKSRIWYSPPQETNSTYIQSGVQLTVMNMNASKIHPVWFSSQWNGLWMLTYSVPVPLSQGAGCSNLCFCFARRASIVCTSNSIYFAWLKQVYLLFTLYKSKISPPELLHPKRPLGFREVTTTAYRFILLYFLSQHLLISYLYLAYMASAQRYFCKLLPFLMSEDVLRAAVRVHPVTQKGEDHEFHFLRYTCQLVPDNHQPDSPETSDASGWKWHLWRLRCTK